MSKTPSVKLMWPKGNEGNARIIGQDAWGNSIEIDWSPQQLADLCELIMVSQGQVFPKITMTRVGEIAQIHVQGPSAELFEKIAALLDNC